MSRGEGFLILIQGRLREGGEADYEAYLERTRPLMARYGARVLAVGEGLESRHTTDSWPINGVLEFATREAAEGFLSDPEYLKIKERYRDRAYETLHLTLVQGRAPRVKTSEEIAREAFADFRHGLATGKWDAFQARLSPGFTFHFPMGRFQGEHRGREQAEEFFRFVAESFPEGIEIEEVVAVTVEGARAVFEFRDRGVLRGQPYRNLVAISLDLCGEQICGYREYFGLVGPPPEGSEHRPASEE